MLAAYAHYTGTTHAVYPTAEKHPRGNTEIDHWAWLEMMKHLGGQDKNAYGSQSFNGHKLSYHQSTATSTNTISQA